MKAVTIGLLVMVLLAMATLSGCHEQSMSESQVTWEPTGTGFWHPTPR